MERIRNSCSGADKWYVILLPLNMKIVEALKNSSSGLRIEHGQRWLYYDDVFKHWVVMEHKYYQRGSTILIETEDEERAVMELLRK